MRNEDWDQSHDSVVAGEDVVSLAWHTDWQQLCEAVNVQREHLALQRPQVVPQVMSFLAVVAKENLEVFLISA